MWRVLDLLALVAVVAAEAWAIRIIRHRASADERYYPSDGAVLWLLTGVISCFLFLGLLTPFLLLVPVCMGCFVGYWALFLWYAWGYRPSRLRNLESGRGGLVNRAIAVAMDFASPRRQM